MVSQGTTRERSFFGKVLETLALIATWISLAMFAEIYGPTQLDLKHKLHLDFQQISFAISGRSVGQLPGGILGGFLADKFTGYCHLMVAVVLDIAAAVTFAVPWSPSMTYMWVYCFLLGVVDSTINIAGTRILFGIWKEKSVTPIMLIHLGYGIGSFVVPMYTSPFLSSNEEVLELYNTVNTTIGNSSLLNTTGSAPAYVHEESQVHYAFYISAASAVIMSVVFYLYQMKTTYNEKCGGRNKVQEEHVESEKIPVEKQLEIKEQPQEKKSFVDMINPATCAGGHFWYGTIILILMFFFFFTFCGGERLLGTYVRTYAVEQLDLSKDSASLLNTVFWIGFAIGRLLFSIIGMFVSVRVLMMVDVIGIAVAGVLLVIFAASNATAYWIIIICVAFFAGPLFPLGVTWTNYHIELTGLGMTLQMLGGSLGGVLQLMMIGYLFDTVGPVSFMYQIMGYSLILLVISILLNTVGSRHGNRFDKDEDETINVDDELGQSKL